MTEARPRVAVLMSTYNCERYVVEQIDSVLLQEGVDIDLYIRDDGSRDSTVDVIRTRYGADRRVQLTSGPNLGACQSFLQVIQDYSGKADYVQLCDADDVWLPDRLIRLVDVLKTASGPAAAHGDCVVVDGDLKPVPFEPLAPSKTNFCFGNALCETVAGGAQTLINWAAFELLQSYRPQSAAMHDSYLYLLLTAFGEVRPCAHVGRLYRQHGGNVAGTGHGWAAKFRLAKNRLLTVSPYRRQAEEFARQFGGRLDPVKKRALLRYLQYPRWPWTRLAFCLWPSICKQTSRASLYMRLTILLGLE